MAQAVAIAGLALSAASAVGQIRQGDAQAAQFKAQGQGLLVQADFERLRGKQESLKSKKEAVNQLQGILEALARVTAVAGAGNVDPFSGNAEGVKVKALNVGGLNVVVANENFKITRLVAEFQASQLDFQAAQAFAAAKAAKKAGITSAMFTLGTALVSFGAAGGFGGAPKPNPGAAAGSAGGSGAGGVAGSTLRPLLPAAGNFTNTFQFRGFGTSAPNSWGQVRI